jgi:hypothetical protein
MGHRLALSVLATATVVGVLGCGGTGMRTAVYRYRPPFSGVYLVARWPAEDKPPPVSNSSEATLASHAQGKPLCTLTFPTNGKSLEILAIRPHRQLGDTVCTFFRHTRGGVFRSLH